MFTGLIQQQGTLTSITAQSDGARLTVSHDAWETPLEPGESVAVQGACLTVTRFDERSCSFDVLHETLSKTALGQLGEGSHVNLERALAVGDRVGGHFVTGHVDGRGEMLRMDRQGADLILEIGAPGELMSGFVPKGSVAIDGISLTVVEVRPSSFTVHIIPWTESHTTLGERKVGDAVNLETDLLGKYALRYMAARDGAAASVSADLLQKTGFMSDETGRGEAAT